MGDTAGLVGFYPLDSGVKCASGSLLCGGQSWTSHEHTHTHTEKDNTIDFFKKIDTRLLLSFALRWETTVSSDRFSCYLCNITHMQWSNLYNSCNTGIDLSQVHLQLLCFINAHLIPEINKKNKQQQKQQTNLEVNADDDGNAYRSHSFLVLWIWP